MFRTRSIALFAVGLVATACDLNFDQRFEQTFALAFDLPESCEGSTTLVRGESRTTMGLSAVDELCHITFEWDGGLLDGRKLREETEKRAGRAIKGVSVERFKGDLVSMALFDGTEASLTLPLLVEWGLELEVDGVELLSFSVVDSASFLTEPVRFAESRALLTAINRGIETRSEVTAMGDGHLVIPLRDFEGLSARSGLELRGELHGDITVKVDVGL